MKNHTRLGLLATALVTMVAPALVLGMSTSAQASDSPPWNTKAPHLSIYPGTTPATSASEGEWLTCNPGEWANGDGPATPVFEYRFYRDSSLLLTDDVDYKWYLVTANDKGHSITCRVRAATDDSDFSAEHSTSPVNVAGTPPTPSGPSAPSQNPQGEVTVQAPSPFYTGYSTLTCNPGWWDNDFDADVYYAWTRNGSPIEGAEENTYLTTAYDSGAKIACLVAKGNDVGMSGYAQSEPVTLPSYKSTPVNYQAPTVSGTAKVGKKLTCNPGAWFNAMTYTYQWYWSSSAAGAGNEYSGRTAKTLTLVNGDNGYFYYCSVVAKRPETAGHWGDVYSAPVASSNRSKKVKP